MSFPGDFGKVSTGSVIVGALVLAELVGDTSLKIAADLGNANGSYGTNLLIGLLSYAIVGGIVYISDSAGLMWGVSNSYWNAINNLVTPLVFMLYFGEVYSTCQWCGFAVISLGILLVGYGG